jgi:hypothetical protein
MPYFVIIDRALRDEGTSYHYASPSDCADADEDSAPSCVSPALQLKREWSPWPEFGSDRGNPRELSKG